MILFLNKVGGYDMYNKVNRVIAFKEDATYKRG